MAEEPEKKRSTSGRFIKGGTPGNPAGRPRGVPNKATQEIRAVARALVTRPAYVAEVRRRLLEGTLAPGMETLLWYYAYGKPKEVVETRTVPPFIVLGPGQELPSTLLEHLQGSGEPE